MAKQELDLRIQLGLDGQYLEGEAAERAMDALFSTPNSFGNMRHFSERKEPEQLEMIEIPLRSPTPVIDQVK